MHEAKFRFEATLPFLTRLYSADLPSLMSRGSAKRSLSYLLRKLILLTLERQASFGRLEIPNSDLD